MGEPDPDRPDDAGQVRSNREGADGRAELPSPSEIEDLLDMILPGQAASAVDSVPRQLGKFRILREVGRGGFGVVFLAEDTQLGRKVALKVPRFDFLTHPEASIRFQREARAASRLHHPNLVPLFEVGALGPVGYIASAYVPGPNLDRWVAQHRSGLPPRWAAQVAAALARGVADIHRQGILHRDLKPANVLLHAPGIEVDPADPETWRRVPADSWVPQVCDFGLAKLLDLDDIETRTRTVCGSPAYMAPEQAEARRGDVGPATDVCGLGAILYKILTGRAPFSGETDLETLCRVAEDDPVPPRARRPEVPRDLETICLKCLAKRPERRYATATELAEDLERFLDGRAIAARPVSSWERLGLWLDRNPERRLLAAMAGLLIAGVTIAVVSRGSAGDEGSRLERLLRRQEDVHRIRSAQQAAIAGNLERAAGLLDESARELGSPDHPNFAWAYLRRIVGDRLRIFRGHERPVWCVAADPAGRTIASGSEGGEIRLWDRESGKSRVLSTGSEHPVWHLVFSSDGRTLASANRDVGNIRLWDVASGRLLGAPECRWPAQVLSMSFADGNRRLAGILSRDVRQPPEIVAWDLTRPGDRPPAAPADDPTIASLARADRGLQAIAAMLDAKTPPGAPTFVDDLSRSWGRSGPVGFACTSDRALIVVGLGDGAFAVYRSATSLRLALGRVRPAGTLLVLFDTSHYRIKPLDRQAERLENLAFGLVAHAPARRRDADRLLRMDHDDAIALAPSRDEIAVWAVAGKSVTVLDTANGEAIASDLPMTSTARSLSFLDGGRSLVIGSADGPVSVWSPDAPGRTAVLPGHAPAEAWAVAFTRDNCTLATAGDDNEVRLWDADTNQPVTLQGGHKQLVTSLAMAPDGETMASGSFDRQVILWDLAKCRPLIRIEGHESQVRAVAFSPDGRHLASCGEDGTVIVWDARKRKESLRISPHTQRACALAFSPDGRTLASGGLDHRIILTDLESGESRSLDAHEQVFALAFLADNGRLVSGHDHGSVRLWDFARGTERVMLAGYGTDVTGLALAPDGRTLATSDANGVVRIWDLETEEEMLTLTDCRARINALAFSRDGMRLAAAVHTGVVRIWDARPRH